MSKTNTGVSPVISIILMVAVTVALVALVTLIGFNIGGNVSDSADATVRLQEEGGSVTLTVIRNENVDEFRLENPTEGNVTISSSPGSTGSLPAGSGTYALVAILSDGSEQILQTIDPGGGSNSGSSGTLTGTVTGSAVVNATVQEIRQDGSIGNETTTDSNGNYTLEVSNLANAQIRVSFVEKSGNSVSVTGSDNVAAGGVKNVNSRKTVDFDFSVGSSSVVSETVNIEGVDEVRYLNGADGVREIVNVYQLQAMNASLSSDFELVSDVNASVTQGWNSGKGFDPIGEGRTGSRFGYPFPAVGESFSGTLDGQGHSINELNINRPSVIRPVGLFAGIEGEQGETEISNLQMAVDINGNKEAGGIAGKLTSGDVSISNVDISGSISAGRKTGGIVGRSEGNLSITDFAVEDVSGGSITGGIAGILDGDLTLNDITVGNVSGDRGVGGVLGDLNKNIDSITDVKVGNISGNGYTGGVIGDSSIRTVSVVRNISVERVSGTRRVGGVIGDGAITSNATNITVGSVSGSRSDRRIGGVIGSASNSIGSITDITVGDVSRGEELGGVIGSNPFDPASNISDVKVGNVSGSDTQVGGVIGLGSSTSITNVTVGSVSQSLINSLGTADLGGVIGEVYDDISNIRNVKVGDVSGPDGDNVGGVVGLGGSNDISNIGDVKVGNVSAPGGDNVGGVVGNSYGLISSITNVSVGSISGEDNGIGGVIGDSSETSNISKIDLGDVISNGTEVGGIVGVGEVSTIRSITVGNVSGLGGSKTGGVVGSGEVSTIGDIEVLDVQSPGGDDVGGVIGALQGGNPTITNGTIRSVNGSTDVGSVIGDLNGNPSSSSNIVITG